jgi:hypothetical protein
MVKLYPSWKVYQGWMGYDPIDKIPIALCKVAVNNLYDMSTSLSFLRLNLTTIYITPTARKLRL